MSVLVLLRAYDAARIEGMTLMMRQDWAGAAKTGLQKKETPKAQEVRLRRMSRRMRQSAKFLRKAVDIANG